MSSKIFLHTPISEKEVRNLKIGDEVYLSGDAYCMLYADHYTTIIKMIKNNEKIPMDLNGMAIYNTGVIWRKNDEGKYINYAIGTTASYKFNIYTSEFIKETGIKAIIGKGGMDDNVLESMKKYGCVFLAIPGGCSSIYTPKAEIVEEYTPAIPSYDNQRLRFKLTNFGPLIVTMDTNGNSLYKNTTENVDESKKMIYKRLNIK